MLVEPKCFSRECNNFLGASGRKEIAQIVVCRAFPEGIPDEIAYGDVLHLESYPGDNGIQFERAK